MGDQQEHKLPPPSATPKDRSTLLNNLRTQLPRYGISASATKISAVLKQDSAKNSCLVVAHMKNGSNSVLVGTSFAVNVVEKRLFRPYTLESTITLAELREIHILRDLHGFTGVYGFRFVGQNGNFTYVYSTRKSASPTTAEMQALEQETTALRFLSELRRTLLDSRPAGDPGHRGVETGPSNRTPVSPPPPVIRGREAPRMNDIDSYCESLRSDTSVTRIGTALTPNDHERLSSLGSLTDPAQWLPTMLAMAERIIDISAGNDISVSDLHALSGANGSATNEVEERMMIGLLATPDHELEFDPSVLTALALASGEPDIARRQLQVYAILCARLENRIQQFGRSASSSALPLSSEARSTDALLQPNFSGDTNQQAAWIASQPELRTGVPATEHAIRSINDRAPFADSPELLSLAAVSAVDTLRNHGVRATELNRFGPLLPTCFSDDREQSIVLDIRGVSSAVAITGRPLELIIQMLGAAATIHLEHGGALPPVQYIPPPPPMNSPAAPASELHRQVSSLVSTSHFMPDQLLTARKLAGECHATGSPTVISTAMDSMMQLCQHFWNEAQSPNQEAPRESLDQYLFELVSLVAWQFELAEGCDREPELLESANVSGGASWADRLVRTVRQALYVGVELKPWQVRHAYMVANDTEKRALESFGWVVVDKTLSFTSPETP